MGTRKMTHPDIWLAGRDVLVGGLGAAGERAFEQVMAIGNETYRKHMLVAMVKDVQLAARGKPAQYVSELRAYKHIPVDVRTFIEDPYFMDAKGILYPEVLRCLIEMNNGEYEEAVLTGGIGCVDADTEYLTPNGWKRIADYQGEEIAQYHLDGRMTFVQPEDYVEYPCQSMYHFKTKYGLDMALSPEHRVLYLDKGGQPKEISALDMYQNHQQTAKGFQGKFITSFTPDITTELPYTDAQIRVMVMVAADGHFPRHRGTTYCVLRPKKERKVQRAQQLLMEAGISYKSRQDGDFTVLLFHAPKKEKSLAFMWEASYAQLQLIAHEVLLWDGEEKRHQYFTTDKASADFVQYVFSSTGKRAVLETFVREGVHGERTDYVVRGNPNLHPTLMGVPKTPATTFTPEDGKKYCFTVSTSYWVARRNGKVFVTGNTGKSTAALYATAYQLYLLSCYKNPHAQFGLDPSSEIVFIFQSINAKLAKTVDYDRFKSMLEKSPYFREKFPFNKDIVSELLFPNRIIVKAVSGSETGAIGQNVIGGIIDEVNFMAVVENSKSSKDGGTYDQAVALYNSIARRRKSRFMSGGRLPGLLCLVSSKRYPDQFTDRKEQEALREIELYGKTSIYIFDKRAWEVRPEGSFSGDWFPIFIGDESRRPRVLREGERLAPQDEHLKMLIPEEYRLEFETDLMNALRDIAGVSTLATHPFIVNREAISNAQRETNIAFSREEVDFHSTQLQIYPEELYKPELPRFVHLDLSVTGDSAGLVIGTVTGFKNVQTAGHGQELLPAIWIDAALEIQPPRGGEILYYKIREVLYALTEMGLNIKWVTFDQFQSVDFMQILMQRGYTVGRQSIDTTIAPYEFTKNALYEGRLNMPAHTKLAHELATLEKDTKRNKVDHPAHSSKDISDALAGVVYGLTTRREVWSMYDIPLGQLPESLMDTMRDKEKKDRSLDKE